VIDAFLGWDPAYRIKVRVITTLAYHALFMHNMLIRPTEEELANFGKPDWIIFNAGVLPADPLVEGVDSNTSVNICFSEKQVVILGTMYAGEMKKGLFTVFQYLLPQQGVLSMHCSANESKNGDIAIFFGLSGTGKTTLSADPKRQLIGDDEHGWGDQGVFNFEGGCYAKMINLSKEDEPQIWQAVNQKGALLENVILDGSGNPDFSDTSLTQNTRGAYPVDFIEGMKIPCTGGHPKQVIFLTCDAFGVLPPVAKLNEQQTKEYFISGYTAKIAGTEQGVTEPEAVFSPCFGGPFLVWHPQRYADLLWRKIQEHASSVWLINTGWTGGPYGIGARISITYTRAIVDAVLSGELDAVACHTLPIFDLEVPIECANVPAEVLRPRESWQNQQEYDTKARQLKDLFDQYLRDITTS
jgi:phosphoenolpyruvate carboxykinase (ATP)